MRKAKKDGVSRKEKTPGPVPMAMAVPRRQRGSFRPRNGGICPRTRRPTINKCEERAWDDGDEDIEKWTFPSRLYSLRAHGIGEHVVKEDAVFLCRGSRRTGPRRVLESGWQKRGPWPEFREGEEEFVCNPHCRRGPGGGATRAFLLIGPDDTPNDKLFVELSVRRKKNPRRLKVVNGWWQYFFGFADNRGPKRRRDALKRPPFSPPFFFSGSFNSVRKYPQRKLCDGGPVFVPRRKETMAVFAGGNKSTKLTKRSQ